MTSLLTHTHTHTHIRNELSYFDLKKRESLWLIDAWLRVNQFISLSLLFIMRSCFVLSIWHFSLVLMVQPQNHYWLRLFKPKSFHFEYLLFFEFWILLTSTLKCFIWFYIFWKIFSEESISIFQIFFLLTFDWTSILYIFCLNFAEFPSLC